MRSRVNILLLVFLLAVRGLVPTGFMLAPSAADGTLSVVICTGHGTETIALDSDGKPVKPGPRSSDSGLCPYAASTPVAPIVATITAVESPPAFAAIAYSVSVDAHRAERRQAAYSARGPPLSA